MTHNLYRISAGLRHDDAYDLADGLYDNPPKALYLVYDAALTPVWDTVLHDIDREGVASLLDIGDIVIDRGADNNHSLWPRDFDTFAEHLFRLYPDDYDPDVLVIAGIDVFHGGLPTVGPAIKVRRPAREEVVTT